MLEKKSNFWRIILSIALLLSTPVSAAESKSNKEEKCKQSFTPKDLGIVLQKHPDEAKLDYRKFKDNSIFLEGKVVTKVEEVESEEAGSYTVEIASGLSLIDSKRKKVIPLEVAYPKNSGNFPVIVFSHAAIASGRDYRALAAFWASHGYVVILPTHSDALTLKLVPGQKVSIFKLLKLANTKAPALKNRALDLSLTIDSLSKLENKVENLNEKLDKTKIALIGDHTGATSAQLLSGVQLRNKKLIQQNQHISAAIYFIRSNWGLPKLKSLDWQNVSTPSMLVSFSTPKNNQEKIRKDLKAILSKTSANDKFLVTVDNTNFKKPSRKKLRKLFKESNIELISFRPFKRFRKKRNKTMPVENTQSVTDANPNELPGSHLASILGLTSMKRKEDSQSRFRFAMSTTIPFLNAYLKEDLTAKESLIKISSFNYGDDIAIKIKPADKLN